MNIYKMLDEFPYGIVVLEGDYVKHICLYPSMPTQADAEGLYDELQKDPEHGMIGEDLSKMNFCPASGELLKEAIRAFSSESYE